MTDPLAASLIELRADPVTRDTIDVNDGIERVMGKRDLYARMLRRFRDDHPRAAAPIAAALADGQAELAHRLTISLKGFTGMIGARRLHAHACELDEALRGHGDAEAALAALVQEFDKVVQLLDILLEGSPTEGEAVYMAVRPLLADVALLDVLEELLRNGDGAAIDMLDESSASLKIILGEPRLDQVIAAARRFEFGAALQALRQQA